MQYALSSRTINLLTARAQICHASKLNTRSSFPNVLFSTFDIKLWPRTEYAVLWLIWFFFSFFSTSSACYYKKVGLSLACRTSEFPLSFVDFMSLIGNFFYFPYSRKLKNQSFFQLKLSISWYFYKQGNRLFSDHGGVTKESTLKFVANWLVCGKANKRLHFLKRSGISTTVLEYSAVIWYASVTAEQSRFNSTTSRMCRQIYT